MNEKIKELDRKAFDEIWDLDKTTIGPPTHFVPDGFEGKFAELIIRECINICENTRYDGQVAANRIKFVFGLDNDTK